MTRNNTRPLCESWIYCVIKAANLYRVKFTILLTFFRAQCIVATSSYQRKCVTTMKALKQMAGVEAIEFCYTFCNSTLVSRIACEKLASPTCRCRSCCVGSFASGSSTAQRHRHCPFNTYLVVTMWQTCNVAICKRTAWFQKNDSSETSSFLEPGAALDCEIRFN